MSFGGFDFRGIIADYLDPLTRKKLDDVVQVQQETNDRCIGPTVQLAYLADLVNRLHRNPNTFRRRDLTVLLRCLVARAARQGPLPPTLNALAGTFLQELRFDRTTQYGDLNVKLYQVINNGIPFVRLRTAQSNDVREKNMIVEAWISMLYLSNTTTSFFFKTVDVLFRCGNLDPKQPSLALACSTSGNTLYLLEEEPIGSQDLSRYLQSPQRTDLDRITMGFILVRALADAANMGVVHFAPEPADLLVRMAPRDTKIFLNRDQAVYASAWPYFDNLSRCLAVPIEDNEYRWAYIDEGDLSIIRDYISLSLVDPRSLLAEYFRRWTPSQIIPDEFFGMLYGGENVNLNSSGLTIGGGNSVLAGELRDLLNPM
jgi:hypothetical protein